MRIVTALLHDELERVRRYRRTWKTQSRRSFRERASDEEDITTLEEIYLPASP